MIDLAGNEYVNTVYTNTTAVPSCQEIGHCLHDVTAGNKRWCCKCGQYIDVSPLWERIGFYEPR